jgi:hypothetical protein
MKELDMKVATKEHLEGLHQLRQKAADLKVAALPAKSPPAFTSCARKQWTSKLQLSRRNRPQASAGSIEKCTKERCSQSPTSKKGSKESNMILDNLKMADSRRLKERGQVLRGR